MGDSIGASCPGGDLAEAFSAPALAAMMAHGIEPLAVLHHHLAPAKRCTTHIWRDDIPRDDVDKDMVLLEYLRLPQDCSGPPKTIPASTASVQLHQGKWQPWSAQMTTPSRSSSHLNFLLFFFTPLNYHAQFLYLRNSTAKSAQQRGGVPRGLPIPVDITWEPRSLQGCIEVESGGEYLRSHPN